MRVTLIDFTGKGTESPSSYAMDLLIFTKSTRLEMHPGLLEEIKAWPVKKKIEELAYMANTIPSSWEFVHYTFLIEGVTRAFTHQLVRTRTASFAQQTMRILNVKGWEYGTGPTIQDHPACKQEYDSAMDDIAEVYDDMIDAGIAVEDARGILPTNILTNIVMSINMRNFVDTVHKRSSPRVQGEYREALIEMERAVINVHPWMLEFVKRTFDTAAADLDKEIQNVFRQLDIRTRKGEVLDPYWTPAEQHEKKMHMMKLVDQMRAKS